MEPANDKEDGEAASEHSEPLQPNRELQHQLAEILKRLDSVEQRLTNLEKVATRQKSPSEPELEKEEAKVKACSDFENTLCDRIVSNVTEIPQEDKQNYEPRENDEGDRPKPKEGLISNKAMLWHVRMGHASMNYLKRLRKKFTSTFDLDEYMFDDVNLDCDVCIISKINRLPLKLGKKAKEPLEIIHFDLLGMISPATYPKEYKYVSIFTDDYSQLTMAYPMKRKDETGYYFELFVKNARDILERDAKISYLKSYQEIDFTNDYMAEILEGLGIELQVIHPETPQHNQVFNQTIQKKVRVLMYDSGLPENMWDLALGSAVFAYNRTPHASNDMKTPFQMFNPNYHSIDLTRLRRFGCLAYVKLNRKFNQKFRFIIKRLILVGYKEAGYVLFNPEDGKFYISREVRFNEKCVFAEKYKRANVNNWERVSKEIDTDKWFIQFEKEAEEQENKEERAISFKRGRECVCSNFVQLQQNRPSREALHPSINKFF